MEHVSQNNLAEKSTEAVKKPVGIGGWLVFFQLRMLYYLGVMAYIMISRQQFIAIFLVLYVGACAMSFYKRNMAFRGMFVGLAAVMIFGGIVAFRHIDELLPALVIGSGVLIDGVLIAALYRSRRVKNTFVKKSEEEQMENEQA